MPGIVEKEGSQGTGNRKIGPGKAKNGVALSGQMWPGMMDD